MGVTTLEVEVFGVGSLVLAFAKYTLERRKTMDAESNMKNPGFIDTA
jgi:hypothetical protein